MRKCSGYKSRTTPPERTPFLPLNPDIWTNLTIGLANTTLLTGTRATLDMSGKGTASLNVPNSTMSSAIGVKFYHAYLVYDASNNLYMASNPVVMTLVR